MENYALKSKQRYPLNTTEQVKLAADYFNSYYSELNFQERVEMAHNVSDRADEMQVKVASAAIKNYSNSQSYSPEFEQNILLRKMACRTHELTIDVLGKPIAADQMIEKIASNKKACTPIKMVQILSEFDKRAGITNGYDNYIKDPYFTVFGSSMNPDYDMEKYAEGVTEDSIKTFSETPGAKDTIMTYFGENMALDFIQDPVGIYKNMPIEEKEAVHNIVRDNNGK